MTPQERAAHREKMLAAKTLEECRTVQEEHHRQMEARARGKGQTLPAPRQNACERMQARGFSSSPLCFVAAVSRARAVPLRCPAPTGFSYAARVSPVRAAAPPQ